MSSGPATDELLGLSAVDQAVSATEGMPTGQGARLWGTGSPTTTRLKSARLPDAGAIVVGKTNTPELGLRPVTENARFSCASGT